LRCKKVLLIWLNLEAVVSVSPHQPSSELKRLENLLALCSVQFDLQDGCFYVIGNSFLKENYKFLAKLKFFLKS